MPTFRKLKDLNTYINVVVEEVLMEVSKVVEAQVLNETKNSVYNRSTSGTYERTWDYLASVTRAEPIFSKGRIDVEIYYDSNKILPNRTEGNGWNEHMDINGNVDSVWNGMSVPELLPLWIEMGTENGLRPIEGVHVLERVYEDMKAMYKQLFAGELRKYGIKAK